MPPGRKSKILLAAKPPIMGFEKDRENIDQLISDDPSITADKIARQLKLSYYRFSRAMGHFPASSYQSKKRQKASIVPPVIKEKAVAPSAVPAQTFRRSSKLTAVVFRGTASDVMDAVSLALNGND